VSSLHLRHLNPFPANLGEVLGGFERVLVPELNSGQLCRLLRAEYLTPAESLGKVEGLPFKIAEIRARIDAMFARGRSA
jgi:2-oxoglutarate ferredoxin oxidoreductase subunit alpha